MSNEDGFPKSKQIGAYSAGDYHVTAASWETNYMGAICTSYEIGIRHLKSGKFYLHQGPWNHQLVQEIASAISLLLGNLTENYSPEWCIKHIGNCDE